MIRTNSIFCNINSMKSPEEFLYTYSSLPNVSPFHCPFCNALGHFKSHGRYERYVIDIKGGKPVSFRVPILRIECDCGHTHALLKDTLIPYCQYSLRFILHVMRAYFKGHWTVTRICKFFQITPPTLYRLKRIYLSHQQLFFGLLAYQRAENDWFLRFIDHVAILSDFLMSFFKLSRLSFLQTHANPPSSRRR